LAGTGQARHLLLASRSGPAADGADELLSELAGLGAQARIAAVDVADREALAAVLAGVPDAHPLTAVVHAAGRLGDATIAARTPQRLDKVLRAKVDAAYHLDELTRDRDLTAFVLFSSVAVVLGSAGLSYYAA